MRIATYSRVSTTHHSQKPEVQVHELRRYCEARGWTIEHELVDHGYSGSSDHRPSLRQLISLVQERKVDVVVVVKMDRLFRSLKHLVTTLEEWQSLGVQFVAVKDNIDYTTPAGRLLAQILGSLAEFEKSLLIERTMLGLEHAKRSGKKLGRPKTADFDKIIELRQQGYSYTQIQKQLGVGRGSIFRALKAFQKPLVSAPQKVE